MNNLKRIVATIAAFLVAGTLTSCGGKRTAPVVNTYRIVTEKPARSNHQNTGRTFSVTRFTASPMVAGREMIYQTGPNTFERSFSQRFLADPAENLESELIAALTSGGEWIYVPKTASVQPDMIIDGWVEDVYISALPNQEPSAVIAVSFLVYHREDNRRSMARALSYREEVPMANNSGAEAASAFSAAYTTILHQLQAELPQMP